MSYLDFKEIPKYEHVCAETIHKASNIMVIPNATQKSIAKYYGINPFLLIDIEHLCDAKYVYAYVLICSTSLSMYDCADEAGVSYEPLLNNKSILDRERQMGSSFGRHLDVIISNHKSSPAHV